MKLRLCSYNIEWFNRLFNKDNSIKTGSKERKRIEAIKNVLKHLNPDLIGITEAPNASKDKSESTTKKLEAFAKESNLPTTKAITGFISSGRQEIAILYNPNKFSIKHSPGGKRNSKSNPRFNEEFLYDTDDDNIKELYRLYRPPLEAKITVKNNGFEFRIIVVHTKSKGIFSNLDRLHWERESQRNRLKLYAECEWIRRHVDQFIDRKEPVIVMGDINDGPGMDYYEFKNCRSAVEILMGDIFEAEKILKSYAGKPKWTANGWKPASTRFTDSFTERPVNVLIDHILVSKGIKVSGKNPHTIWNPYENNIAKVIKPDLALASDHFPVTLDISV